MTEYQSFSERKINSPESQLESVDTLIKQNPGVYEKLDSDQELAKLVESLDYSLIESLFQKLHERYHIEGAAPVSKDRIVKLSKKYPAYANFSNKHRMIALGSEGIKASLEREQHPELFKLLVLYNFFHEQTHAVSKQDCGKKTESVGLQVNKISWLFPGFSFFEALNEIVTDRVGKRLAEEYRTASYFDTTENAQELWNIFSEKTEKDFPPYELLKEVVLRIAKQAGLTEDVVWNAFEGSMLKGELLTSKELQEGIDEVTYPGFVKEWADTYINDPDAAQRILAKLKGTEPPPSATQRILQSLGLSK